MSSSRAFWPLRGPRWDALARYRNGCILVEAKSHVAEIYGGGCRALKENLAVIQSALTETKKWLGVPGEQEPDWLGRLYQSANRYAHLYFLHQKQVACYLANVYFTDDPIDPTSEPQWRTEIEAVKRELGLKEETPYCRSMILHAYDFVICDRDEDELRNRGRKAG